ncbi:MAG: YeeE/YedE family protein [Pseudohongiellaceae bacterium]
MEHFTPVQALVGGLLIGTAATLTLWTSGRIAGISGILAGSLFQKGQEAFWRGLFLCGLLLGGATYSLFNGGLKIETEATPLMTILAGLLVGFGTRMGNGCTSGHGVCGIARFSRRSLVATFTFIMVAMLTVWVIRHV